MSLADTFAAHVAAEAAARLPDAATLEATLTTLLQTARAAWPQLTVPDDAFVRHLAERLPPEGEPALAATFAADLFLACACTTGDPAAIAAFERDFMSQVATYLARQETTPAFTEELKQILRTGLLVGDGDSGPRLGLYTGRGPLGAWLRVTTVRSAIDPRRMRNPGDANATEPDLVLRSAAPDPELRYLRSKYAEEFRAAFEQTLAALSDREGNVLRLYFLDAMPAEAIGTQYQTSARTVQRWIAQTRQKILDETYRLLRERLKVSNTELGALLALVESQVDVSISRFQAK